MSTRVQRKIAISLPDELVAYADQQAALAGTSRSQVISTVLAQARERERARLAAEGYRFYAGEAAEFAEASIQAVSAAWDSSASIGEA